MEGVDQVVEGGLEDGEEAEAHADKPDEGRDPEYFSRGCPSCIFVSVGMMAGQECWGLDSTSTAHLCALRTEIESIK